MESSYSLIEIMMQEYASVMKEETGQLMKMEKPKVWIMNGLSYLVLMIRQKQFG